MDTPVAKHVDDVNVKGWIAALSLFGVVAWFLPVSAMAAALALGAAALWLLSQSRERPAPSSLSTGAVKDEDLGLPPPKSQLRSGAASRKASVDFTSASRPVTNRVTPRTVTGESQAATAQNSSNGTNHVVLAANSTDVKAAKAVPSSGATTALPAVEAPKPSGAQAAAVPAAPKLATSQQQTSPVQPAAEAAQPVALTGSAAILAKLRSQRQTSSGPSAAAASKEQQAPKVTVLYASQTGTGQEIARTIHAECSAQGMQAQVMSFNEVGFDNLTAAKTPVVVFVASSTGDGDPPDNAAAAYVAMKKPWASDRLAGIKFTVLGLGDSNYTRFMHVSRAIKSRFQDLGATCFYNCAEADEVDGLEATVDPWCENLLTPLQKTLQEIQQQKAAPAANGLAAANGVAAAGSAQPAVSAANTQQPSAAVAAEQSVLGAEQSVLGADLLATVSHTGEATNAAAFGTPQVQMELSAASQGAGELSGQASLLGEDSSASQPDAPAAKQQPAARVTSAAGKAAAGPSVQLVNGLAPADVDLKGVPALAPCRVVIDQQVSAAVADAARAKENAIPTAEQKSYRDDTGHYGPEQPFWAKISDARLMTAKSSDRTVIHMELDIRDSGMKYGPGDAVGVLPQNASPLVTGLLQRLGLDGDRVFELQPASGAAEGQRLLSHIPWPCTLRYAFTHCTDLTSVPRKSLLRMLAEHCSDADEQRTLLFFTSRAGKEAYAAEITAAQPSLLDLLRRFPSCNPSVDALLDALQPLAPRMYSLTCAPVTAAGANGVAIPGACGPTKLQFAFSVVEFETKYGTRRGVASNWLAKLCRPWLSSSASGDNAPEVLIPLFHRPAMFFKPPASLATPLIMIGPGTGVAPFRGFLQQRLADMQASGETSPAAAVLYFGCRKPDEDYLYEQDWQQFTAAGVLQKLRVAFSRTQETKVYVQHLMREDASELAQLMNAGAHVYVCGDGAAMAKDVHAALCEILKSEKGLSDAQAAEELAAMTKSGRYVRDIWS